MPSKGKTVVGRVGRPVGRHSHPDTPGTFLAGVSHHGRAKMVAAGSAREGIRAVARSSSLMTRFLS